MYNYNSSKKYRDIDLQNDIKILRDEVYDNLPEEKQYKYDYVELGD